MASTLTTTVNIHREPFVGRPSLWGKYRILDSTLRRLTRSNRRAIVWVTSGHMPHKIVNRAMGQVPIECDCGRRTWHAEGGPYPCKCEGPV
ncbi:MAG: hypothetical protein JSV86_10400 [Gemmatimonadota bacterium]|nr:MAG: hypothetical protein JSV86_10400 [Gemmatimonadota bacterium]